MSHELPYHVLSFCRMTKYHFVKKFLLHYIMHYILLYIWRNLHKITSQTDKQPQSNDYCIDSTELTEEKTFKILIVQQTYLWTKSFLHIATAYDGRHMNVFPPVERSHCSGLA